MNALRELLNNRARGMQRGICSVCSANELVIEAALELARDTDSPALIEATANQVNQYGGYTGMKPEDFSMFVRSIAQRVGCPERLVILGGDHLGPLNWQAEAECDAMQKSRTLIGQFVRAGFAKIHIDTSMRLRDDDPEKPLPVEVVARRSAELAAVAEEAFAQLLQEVPDAVHPVYVVGSEVPIPGGAQENEDSVSVTAPEEFLHQMDVFARAYHAHGLDAAFANIVGFVVQPGVEFADDSVVAYSPEKARALIQARGTHPQIVFEGHSTDYQTRQCLRDMVTDGIAILKVGPALTFALREALFALEGVEREVAEGELSGLRATLEAVMLENPVYWKKYYHGTDRQIAVKRAFSYSDRCRYYLADRRVGEAMDRLLANVDRAGVPMSVLSQFLPVQYLHAREGQLEPTARALVKDRVRDCLMDYWYAVEA